MSTLQNLLNAKQFCYFADQKDENNIVTLK